MAVSVQIYVHPETHKAWKMRAIQEGFTLSEMVRRVMAAHMAREGGKDAPKSGE